MRQLSYQQFAQYTSDIKLPIVKVLKQRKDELWTLVKHQREPYETARLQGQMVEIDALIESLSSN